MGGNMHLVTSLSKKKKKINQRDLAYGLHLSDNELMVNTVCPCLFKPIVWLTN